MKNYLMAAVAAVSLMTGFSAQAADKYVFDKEHTNILFYVNHLGFSEMVGMFRDYDGYFMFDEKKPEESKVEITLRPSGIRTSSEKLDEHLQAADWFNTEKYPTITFKSSKVEVTGKNTADVTGWLNMLGQEKAVVMHVKLNGTGLHPMSKKQVAGFTGEATLQRSAWGMKNGIPMVGDEVRLYFSTEGNAVDAK